MLTSVGLDTLPIMLLAAHFHTMVFVVSLHANVVQCERSPKQCTASAAKN